MPSAARTLLAACFERTARFVKELAAFRKSTIAVSDSVSGLLDCALRPFARM